MKRLFLASLILIFTCLYAYGDTEVVGGGGGVFDGDLTGNLTLEDTISSSTGVVLKDTIQFMHNFHHPTGDTAVPDGSNVFLGKNAGNFTMGSTATATAHSSRNVGIGTDTLKSLVKGRENSALGDSVLSVVTDGASNSGVGATALSAVTTGGQNSAFGAGALEAVIVGTHNTCIGFQCGHLIIGYNNTALGSDALGSATNSNNNVANGYYALYGLASGAHSNIGLGYEAGRRIEAGTPNTTPNNSIFIGTDTRAATASDTNQLVIGHNAIGNGSNTVTLGNVSTTDNYFNGSIHSNGSLNIYNGTVVFTNYSVTAQDYTIFANATTTGTSMYLPDATTVEGMHARFKKKDSTDNHITINAVGGQTIDGVATKVLEQTDNAIMVYSDGSNWEVLQATSVAHFGEMHVHDNSTDTVIDTATTPHLMQGLFADEDSEGYLFVAGSTGPISAFTEYSTVVSGTTQVTDVGHGLSSGAILSISGTTSYNGIFEATVIDSDNYYIVDTFVADDATGNWYEGDKLINDTGRAAKYKIDFNGFGVPETNNDVLSFHMYKDATIITSLESKRKFTSSTDVGSITASGLVTIDNNEALTFGIINTTGTGNFTMEHVNVVVHSF